MEPKRKVRPLSNSFIIVGAYLTVVDAPVAAPGVPGTGTAVAVCRTLAGVLQVSYFYDASLGDFYYGPTHPMKPHRVRMAHDLIVRYDLYKHLQVWWGCCMQP
jgi:hypothetical protein